MMATEWRDFAACRGLSLSESTRLFFGRGSVPPKARAMCAGCPARAACLAAAMAEEGARPEAHLVGFRGGLSSGERYRLRAAVA